MISYHIVSPEKNARLSPSSVPSRPPRTFSATSIRHVLRKERPWRSLRRSDRGGDPHWSSRSRHSPALPTRKFLQDERKRVPCVLLSTSFLYVREGHPQADSLPTAAGPAAAQTVLIPSIARFPRAIASGPNVSFGRTGMPVPHVLSRRCLSVFNNSHGHPCLPRPTGEIGKLDRNVSSSNRFL
jgi:hypothetical protein